MNAMADALKAAGISSADEQLCDIAEEILRKYPKDWTSVETATSRRIDPEFPRLKECALKAIIDSNNNWDKAKDELFKAVQKDARLLWALFEPYRLIAAQKLLSEVMAEMRASAKARGGGPGAIDSHNATASSPRQTDRQRQQSAAAPSGSGHIFTGDHGPIARPAPLINPPAKDPRAGMNAVIKVVRESLLDTFKIELSGANGSHVLSIGDCRPSEALAWAGSRERDVRFIRLLTQNLPPDAPIRRFRTAEEADNLFAKASEAIHAE